MGKKFLEQIAPGNFGGKVAKYLPQFTFVIMDATAGPTQAFMEP